ncbi:MAG: hypothetical protein ACR2QA_05530 [Solirubrobacteraceae bacterium]
MACEHDALGHGFTGHRWAAGRVFAALMDPEALVIRLPPDEISGQVRAIRRLARRVPARA